MKPILSIIIPTKNRYKYLESCLSALSVNYSRPEVEIIITDNSSVKQNIESLSLFSNINYTYIDKPISQVENFEKAMSKVSGEFVTMIGDDDGLSNKMIEVVKFMKNNNIDALNSPFVSYYWPDIVTKNKVNNFSGKLFFEKYKFNISGLNSINECIKCLKLGGTSLCKMPRMYYGLLKTSLLIDIKKQTGYFFPGPSPDMANAFSASLNVKNFVYFDAPLFIAGNSAKSAAGQGLAGKHQGSIENNPQLPKDCHVDWTMSIPKFWSGPTIWAESTLKVIQNSKRYDLEKKFNFIRLYASCLVFHPIYKTEILRAIQKYKNDNNTSIYFLLNWEIFNVWVLRLYSFARNLFRKYFNKSLTSDNILNIEEASLALNKFEKEINEMLKYEY
jgi:hypothetical protein